MSSSRPAKVAISKTKRRAQCLENHLVLQSAGIDAEVIASEDGWLLVVEETQQDRAVAELDAYAREHQTQHQQREPPQPRYRGAGAGVGGYIVVNLLIAYWVAQSAYGVAWMPVGDMRAGEVLAGQWWRIFTALTLHADVGHLTANLVFGTLFGFLAGQALGGGVAWLVILLSGALGNLVNAFFQSPQHISIGASTAVFAALGVLVAHTLRSGSASPEPPIKRWSPLVGGLLLLALLGVGGPDTDVMAHVAGFLVGIPAGWLAGFLPKIWLRRGAFQQLAGTAALVILASAWLLGIWES